MILTFGEPIVLSSLCASSKMNFYTCILTTKLLFPFRIYSISSIEKSKVTSLIFQPLWRNFQTYLLLAKFLKCFIVMDHTEVTVPIMVIKKNLFSIILLRTNFFIDVWWLLYLLFYCIFFSYCITSLSKCNYGIKYFQFTGCGGWIGSEFKII